MSWKEDIQMNKVIALLTCLFLEVPCQPTVVAADHVVSGSASDVQRVVSLFLDTPGRQAVRYRLVEGSTLLDECTICGRPPIIVPIRGSFWLEPNETDPLFSNFIIRRLHFRSSNPVAGYEGSMNGTYRIGGEVALVEQMILQGYINRFEGLKLDSKMVIPQARFPWIEIDVPQVSPDPYEPPYQYFSLHLVAVPWPAMWFSTEYGFHPSKPTPVLPPVLPSYISDGDLLSSFGTVVRTNYELTARLGIMPVVPDLGLDAVLGWMPRLSSDLKPIPGEIWFSTEDGTFSETLGEMLQHADLVSDAGRIVRHNIDLISPFSPQPPVPDYGLDAVALHPNGILLFSTEEDFFSESLGLTVSDGDLLCQTGQIFKRVGELLANFQPIDPRAIRFGLDAVYVWPHGEIWFSIEEDFTDQRFGPIAHGDLLSDTGRVVARNAELLEPYAPVEDLADFGLDALHIVWPSLAADINFDRRVDLFDFAAFAAQWLRADCGPCAGADFTGDSEVRLDDLHEFAENWLTILK
jgi:hypothetical protein